MGIAGRKRENIQYLGIYVLSESSFMSPNKPQINSVQNTLISWRKLKLSWFTRYIQRKTNSPHRVLALYLIHFS